MSRAGAATRPASGQAAWSRWAHRRLPRLIPGGGSERLPLTLHRRRIYILPTRYGVFFGFLVFVMLLGSLNYNNNLALLLTFLLGGVMLIAPVHTYRNLAGLRVVSCQAPPVFCGRDALFALLLANAGDAPRVTIRGWNGESEDRTTVGPGGEAPLRLMRHASRRGRVSAGRVRLYTEYPLGLFHAWTWLDEPGSTLVYPRPGPRGLPLPPPGGRGRSGMTRQEDDEFTGIRDYRPGDPARRIAWKALARTDQLMSKVYEAPAGDTLWLDFQEAAGDTEARLSALTRWILDAEAANLRYGLRLPGETIPPGRREAHRDRCLRALALFGTT